MDEKDTFNSSDEIKKDERNLVSANLLRFG